MILGVVDICEKVASKGLLYIATESSKIEKIVKKT